MKKILFPLFVVIVLLTTPSCKYVSWEQPYYPEIEMYYSWNNGFMRVFTDRMTVVRTLYCALALGDTLTAYQVAANAGWIIDGLEDPVDSIGTCWTVYGLETKDTLFAFCHEAESQYLYYVPYIPASEYVVSRDFYGCSSYCSVRFNSLVSQYPMMTGTGYINTDGSADLYFDLSVDDVTQTRYLTLTAYAHKYDETVIYHYYLYSSSVLCEETGQRVQ